METLKIALDGDSSYSCPDYVTVDLPDVLEALEQVVRLMQATKREGIPFLNGDNFYVTCLVGEDEDGAIVNVELVCFDDSFTFECREYDAIATDPELYRYADYLE